MKCGVALLDFIVTASTVMRHHEQLCHTKAFVKRNTALDTTNTPQPHSHALDKAQQIVRFQSTPGSHLLAPPGPRAHPGAGCLDRRIPGFDAWPGGAQPGSPVVTWPLLEGRGAAAWGGLYWSPPTPLGSSCHPARAAQQQQPPARLARPWECSIPLAPATPETQFQSTPPRPRPRPAGWAGQGGRGHLYSRASNKSSAAGLLWAWRGVATSWRPSSVTGATGASAAEAEAWRRTGRGGGGRWSAPSQLTIARYPETNSHTSCLIETLKRPFQLRLDHNPRGRLIFSLSQDCSTFKWMATDALRWRHSIQLGPFIG